MSSAWEAIAALLFLLFIGLVTDGLVLLVRRIIRVRVTSRIKVMRFEAGNVPIGPVKSTLPIQYVGYMLMFLGVEPIVSVLLALSIGILNYASMLGYAALVSAFIATYAPLIYVAYNDIQYVAYVAPRLSILGSSGQSVYKS